MKLSLTAFLLFLSLNTLADQADILAKQRDHFLENSMSMLRKYCSLANEYVCRQQLEIDCNHGEEAKIKKACATLKQIKQFEKFLLSADKNLAGMAYIELPDKKAALEEIKEATPVVAPKKVQEPAYRNASIGMGADLKEGKKEGASNEEIKAIVELRDKISSMKYRIDCDSDADCQYQPFGQKICGGPVGYFPYSTKGGESLSLASEVSKFNALDDSFIKKWNRDLLGSCEYRGPSEKSVCGVNGCQ